MRTTSSNSSAAAPGSSTAQSLVSAPIASVGLALALYLYELRRMSSFQHVWAVDLTGIPSFVVSIATLALFAIAYARRSSFRLHRHTSACFILAGIFSFIILGSLNADVWPLGTAWLAYMPILTSICETLLLLCWGETLLLLSSRQAALTCINAFIILGLINAFSCTLTPSSSGTIIALFPLLSTLCLYWFKDRALAMNDAVGGVGGGTTNINRFDRSLIPDDYPLARVTTTLSFFLPLLCCPIVFGYIHYSWIPLQDGGNVSLYIQLAAALGTTLGGIVLLLLVQRFWGRRKIALYGLFALLVIMFAFSMVGFFSDDAPWVYVVFLNIAHKIVFFLVWIVPFVYPKTGSPLTVWCVAFGLYQLGKATSTLAHATLDPRAYGLVAASCTVVLIVGIILGITLDQGKHAYPKNERRQPDGSGRVLGETGEAGGLRAAAGSSKAGGSGELGGPGGLGELGEPGGPGELGGPGEPSQPRDEDLPDALSIIAARYHLSLREQDVLRLLAQGMVARDVAETLVISNSTAKTHMRNLYAKLDIHSQTELLLLINRTQ